MKLFTLRMDADVLERLRAVQEQEGVTVAEQIRRTLRACLRNTGSRRAPETKSTERAR